MIIRQKEPHNLETPLHHVDSVLTPTELFCVRSHFPIPNVDLAAYRLRIDGAVRNPLSLSYQELRNLPAEKQVATLECAGNGRVFLVPQVEGAQWELNASREPGLRGCRRCLGGRERGRRGRGEHGRWSNLGQCRLPGPCAAACVAALAIGVADTEAAGTLHPAGPGPRQQRQRPARDA